MNDHLPTFPIKPIAHSKKEESEDCKSQQYSSAKECDSDADINPNHQIAEMTPDKSFCRFNETIGMGAFKKVYKGYDFNAGREIAWSAVQIDSNIEKVYEEIAVMKQLNHPNLIKYITGWYDQQKKEVVIITELASGGSLLSHLRRITTSPRLRLIKSWIMTILIGLNYLHTEVKPPLIHCDIKCDNICFELMTGKVKIGDLGGCEVLHHDYASHYVGTEEFMAPEVIEGKYSTKADIYSLGISIIELITLQLPYKECEGVIMKIYDNAKKGILPRALKRIKNQKLVELIEMCLKSEKERPTAAELIKNEFLNDTTSEENDHPVQFKNIVEIDKISSTHSHFYQSQKNAIDISSKKEVSLFRKILHDNNNTSTTTSNSNKESIGTPSNSDMVPNSPRASSNNNNAFFDINIYENHDIATVPGKRTVNVTFLVDKKEWLTTKKIDFEYDIDKDTIEEVVVELRNCINLSKEESEVVKKKLTIFLSNSPMIRTMKSSNSHLNSNIKSSQLEFFNESYNKTMLKLKFLLESKDAHLLNQIIGKYPELIISNSSSPSGSFNSSSFTSLISSDSLKDQIVDYHKKVIVMRKIIKSTLPPSNGHL